MPPSDFLDLHFDAYERLSALVDMLGVLDLRADSWIADIGGHPGFLSQMLPGRRVVTADFPKSGTVPYVRASGTALPFRDGAFECVVSSDVLEHVPSDRRAKFLDELWRVSSRFVILGGPFGTPGTALAESCLRRIYGQTHAEANAWLEEHARYGLPDLTSTVRHFEELGGKWAVQPNGDIVRWFCLFAAQSLLDDLPGGTEIFRSFMPAHNRDFANRVVPDHGYRQLLVVGRDDEFPERLSGSDWRTDPAALLHEDPMVDARIQGLFQFFEALSQPLSQLARRGEESGTLAAAYVAQLE